MFLLLERSLVSLLLAKHSSLLSTRLAFLVGTDPFPTDRPWAIAGAFFIVAGEVAVFDKAATSVAALEVNDFVLHASLASLSACAMIELPY